MARAILHDYWRSSAAYRVRIALNLKDIDYDQAPVDLAAGEQRGTDYRALNPQGFVPMLQIDGLRLTQSLAIIVYLDQTHPDPPLMPRGPADGAHVRAMAMTVACDIHPLNNLRVLQELKGPLGHDQATVDAWVARWISEGFAALEAMASPRAGRFLFGDAPTIADLCLVPQMYNARRFNVPVDAFPTLVRADTNASALEAFARAHPDQNKEPQ
jgi:maleylacetoacetate isomerase